MKYYSTKYALTKGILEIEGEIYKTEEETTYISYGNHGFDKLGKDIFSTRQEAIDNAESKRLKKIKNVEIQLKKLKAKSFKENG